MPGLALFGSDEAGVGCNRADRLALLPVGRSEWEDLGGVADRALCGGVLVGPAADIAGNGP